VEDLEHPLVHCQANGNVGMALMNILRLNHPALSVEASLRLELDVPADDELSTVWLLAATLLAIWEQRQASNNVQPYLVRAQLEAKVNLLRQTSFSNCATLIKEKVQLMFEYC
jgi:hypothetical protein